MTTTTTAEPKARDTAVRIDATSVITAYVVLLLALPPTMRIAALGTAGAPATVLGLILCGWLAVTHLQRTQPLPTPARVRVAIGALVVAVFASYAYAMSAPMPLDEITPADSGVLRILALAGVVMVLCDAASTTDRHRILVERLVLVVGAVAFLGLVQNFTGQLWIDRIHVPGLSSGAADATLSMRSGLARPSGTAAHPIEYGVVLTTVLPLAITTATHATRHLMWHRIALGLIGVSALLSLSRSAILCAVVGLLILAVRWPARTRLRAGGAILVLLAFVYVAVPGVLGTLTSLFTGASEDPSVASRTASWSVAWSFISHSPVLGRGLGTFLPTYWILDNQYLGLVIEIGVVGILAFLGVIVAAASAARSARAAATTDADRDLSHALLASVLAGAAGFAFFDTLSFPQSAGVFFVVVGLCGTALRLHSPIPQREEVPC